MTSTLIHFTESDHYASPTNGHHPTPDGRRLLDQRSVESILHGLKRSTNSDTIAGELVKLEPGEAFTASKIVRKTGIATPVVNNLLFRLRERGVITGEKVEGGVWEFRMTAEVHIRPIPRKPTDPLTCAAAVRQYLTTWPIGERRDSDIVYKELEEMLGRSYSRHGCGQGILIFGLRPGILVNIAPNRGKGTRAVYERRHPEAIGTPAAAKPAPAQRNTEPPAELAVPEPEIEGTLEPDRPNAETHKLMGALDVPGDGKWRRFAEFPEGVVEFDVETLRDGGSILWMRKPGTEA